MHETSPDKTNPCGRAGAGPEPIPASPDAVPVCGGELRAGRGRMKYKNIMGGEVVARLGKQTTAMKNIPRNS